MVFEQDLPREHGVVSSSLVVSGFWIRQTSPPFQELHSTGHVPPDTYFPNEGGLQIGIQKGMPWCGAKHPGERSAVSWVQCKYMSLLDVFTEVFTTRSFWENSTMAPHGVGFPPRPSSLWVTRENFNTWCWWRKITFFYPCGGAARRQTYCTHARFIKVAVLCRKQWRISR